MAVKVTNTNVDLGNGLSIDQFYLRIEVSIEPEGDSLRIRTETYYSKDFYKNKKRLSLPLRLPVKIDYDRETDGNDILDIAHQKIKDSLIEKGYSESNISIVDYS